MIRGVDNRPYIEVTDHESRAQSLALKALKYSALGSIGLYGAKWAVMNVRVEMDPRKLSYLHEGLSTTENPWWKVAGLEETGPNKAKVRVKDFILEGVKRTEELMGGIPRTFGAFGMLSRDNFTNANSKLILSPQDLDGAWSHYEALIANDGGTLTALDRERGFIVQGHQGKPGLFRIGDGGIPEATPLVENVKVGVRRWSPDGVDDYYRQIIRGADSVSEAMGAKPIVHSNEFPFVVSKASGNIKIKGVAREALEVFGNPDVLENAINKRLTPGVHQVGRDVSVLSKRMSERYMRILDQPLEFIEELVYGGPNEKGGILRKAAESKPYSFFKNVFGTGGNYKGSTTDLWARHAGRLAIATVGLAATYEAGSFVTKALFDKSLAQVGGEAIGATERLYAGMSDMFGLTKLNKAQKENASGSERLFGVLAFPLSGYITGHTIAGLTTQSVTGKGEFGWRIAREETREVPGILKKLENVPVIGKFFKGPKTRGGVFGAIGMAIGGVLSAPFLLGALGSSRSYEEVVEEQRGETEVAVRKGAMWEMGKTDTEGEHIQYYRPGWYRRLQDDPKGDLQFDEYNDRPFTRMIKEVTDPYWREKKFYHERPYPITGPDTTGFGPLGTLWGMTLGRVFKQPKIMHADELSAGGAEGVREGDVIRYGMRASELPDADLGGLGPAKVVSPYDQSFLAGEGVYKITEAIGLPGFAYTALKKKLTGEQDLGTDEPVLSSFAEMGSLRDNFWDLNIGGGMGTCFARETLVKTDCGLRPIEEIEEGDLVLSKDGYRKVIGKLEKEPEESLIELKMSSTGTSFQCTGNHRIPVLRRKVYKAGHVKPFNKRNIEEIEIQAKDILPGDFLYYPIDSTEREAYIDLSGTGIADTDKWVYYQASYEFAKAYEFLEENPETTRRNLRGIKISDLIAKEALRQFRKNQMPKRIVRYQKIDNDLAWVIGWYLAEGSVDSGKLTLTMNANEKEYAERIGKIFKDKFDANWSIKIKENTLRLRVYSSSLARYFKRFGLNAKEKFIPNELKQLPKRQLSELLDGLILGDGWGHKESKGGFTSASDILVRDLFDCLLKLGIGSHCNINYREIPKGNYPQDTPRKEGVRSYLDFNSGKLSWRFFKNFYLVKVKEIYDIEYSGLVYDLEIEDLHYYTAEGYLVHNSEGLRRVIPSERFQLQKVNPIKNEMPDWMPGPEYFQDFQHGDAYGAIPEGEYRLPGTGYASRFKELEGVNPADYPLIHQYKILADVAPYSKQFKEVSEEIESMATSGELNERDMTIYRGTEQQLQERAQKIPFPKDEGLVGSYWSALKKIGRLNPVEKLLPVSPVHKFAGRLDPISEYEDKVVYSKASPNWGEPLEDFIKPALYSIGRMLGWDGIPGAEEEKRDLTEYFDKVEFMKYKKLEKEARIQGDGKAAYSFARKADYTMYGADPYARVSDVERVLPREDRMYFRDFLATDDPAERGRILELVPEYTRKFYIAQWQKQNYAALAAKGDLTEDEQLMVKQIEASRALEGQQVEEDDWNEYQDAVSNGDVRPNTFPDYIRAKKLGGYFEDESPLDAPPSDWLGYDPAVDMDGVKLRVVQSLGCLLPGQMMFTENGIEEVTTLTYDSEILSSDGIYYKPKRIFNHMYKGKTLTLKLGGRFDSEIKLTEDHKVPVLRNAVGGYRYKEIAAKDINKTKDRLMFPKIEFSEDLTSYDMRDFSEEGIREEKGGLVWFKYTRNPIKRAINITKELGFICGWYLAEGSISGRGKGISIDLSAEEGGVAKELAAAFANVFGVKARIKRPGGYYQVRVSGRAIQNFLTHICGTRSRTKALNSSVLKWSKETIVEFAKAWHNGDGWDDGKQIHWSTTSYKLADQWWWILNSLGFRTRLNRIEKVTNFGPTIEYRLSCGTLQHREALKKSELPEYTPTLNDLNKQNLNDKFWFGIKSIIKEDYDGEVFDFAMPKDSYYVTIGGILHNSDFHDFDLWESDVADAAGKPYLEVAADQLMEQNQSDRDELLRSLTAANISDLDIEIVATGGDKTRVVFDIGQDRTGELKSELEKLGIRYGV